MQTELALGQNADHSGVIRAKGFIGQHQGEPLPFAGGTEALAQRAIAGDAARDRNASHTKSSGSTEGLSHQHVHNGRLNAGAEVAQTLCILEQFGVVAQKVSHGGFQTAKAKIVIRLINHRTRENERLGISVLGEPVYLWSRRIRQSHQFPSLVETFARSIIYSRADQVVV